MTKSKIQCWDCYVCIKVVINCYYLWALFYTLNKFIFHVALTGKTNGFFSKHDKYFHRILLITRHTQFLLPVHHSFILYIPLKYRIKHRVMSKMEAKFISQCFFANTIDSILCWIFFCDSCTISISFSIPDGHYFLQSSQKCLRQQLF